jgi:hypothetical protein
MLGRQPNEWMDLLEVNERHQSGPHDDQTKHYSDYGNIRAHHPGLRRIEWRPGTHHSVTKALTFVHFR